MLSIPALRKQRKVGRCEFQASLVYKVSFRAARAVYIEKPSQKAKGGGAEKALGLNTGLGFSGSG